jgi:F-type H+-transporting ATPase subunit epsilon
VETAAYTLSVLTPERPVFEKDVVSIVAPGSEGYLGILAHHAPLITALGPGKLTVTDPEGNVEIYAVSGGFLEVGNNEAILLADTIEAVSEIDVERARRAEARARERLKGLRTDIDYPRCYNAMARAQNRLRIAEALRVHV